MSDTCFYYQESDVFLYTIRMIPAFHAGYEKLLTFVPFPSVVYLLNSKIRGITVNGSFCMQMVHGGSRIQHADTGIGQALCVSRYSS